MIRLSALLMLLWVGVAQAAEKRALVIGNNDYFGKWQLTNPVNDAADVATALRNLDFEVALLQNANSQEMSAAVQSFSQVLDNGDVALFYFSGHGFSGEDVNGRQTNFLVGSFAEQVTTDIALKFKSVDTNFVVQSLRARNKGGINIVVLDACRNVPESLYEFQYID